MRSPCEITDSSRKPPDTVGEPISPLTKPRFPQECSTPLGLQRGHGGLVNLIDHAGMAYTLAECKLPDGYLRGNRTPLYRCSTAWHTRPMKAAPRVRSARFSSNGIVIWSCHEHLDVNQPVQTPSVSGRDHQPWSVALLPLLSELP